MYSWNSRLDLKTRRPAPAPRRAWRVGWPTALSIGSAIALDGMLSDMRRWRWGFPVLFPMSFANSPKRTCDHHRSLGKTRLWGVFGVGIGPSPEYPRRSPPAPPRAIRQPRPAFRAAPD